jgi:hypothetical protein
MNSNIDETRSDLEITDVTYIFDTSSIRIISSVDLSLAVGRVRLAVSPITILELLCHLDESHRQSNMRSTPFEFFKRNLLKIKIPELLNDPWAEQADAVGARNIVNPSRFEERLVLPELLSKLELSQTLEDFYRQRITFPNGDIGAISDVSVRVRNILNQEEIAYGKRITNLCRTMLEDYSFDEIQQLTPVDFIRIVTNSANSLARSYKESLNHLRQTDISGAVFSVYGPYFGYIAARAIHYLLGAHGSISALNIDLNDLEDSGICGHLHLTKNRILVTNDRGTQDALSKFLQDLHSASTMLNQPVVALTEVINANEFERRTIPKHH